MFHRSEWVEVKTPSSTAKKTKKRKSNTVADSSVCARVATSNGHRQLRAGDLAEVVQNEQMQRKDKPNMLLLINEDLFGNDEDLFVAGMAYIGMGIGVFSTFRYALDFRVASPDSYWFDCSHAKELQWAYSTELIRRLGRLGAHELLHLFGVLHCIDYSCMMNGSGHLEEDLRQPLLLCPIDLYKIASVFGFHKHADLLELYMKPLYRKLEELGLSPESQQVKKMIETLT